MQPKHIMKMPTICTLIILVLKKAATVVAMTMMITPIITNLVISGFRHGVNEICALLGFYAA